MEYDTNIGGSVRAFPTTVWADILSAADPNNPLYREALDRLFRTYWKPVYAYVRAAWRKSNEEAKDLTQAFFTHLLEKETLARMRPDRGSFRGYLKLALSHFLIDAERYESVRRPKGPVFHLDAREEEIERIEPPAPDVTPEEAYDREWFRSVLDAAVESLRVELCKDGKGHYFDVFRTYCLEPQGLVRGTKDTKATRETLLGEAEIEEGPTYREVALKYKITETEVRHYLAHCRGALRRLLRGKIREYTAREEDVDPELQQVLKG